MFGRSVSREIAVIYHQGLLSNPSIERMRRLNVPYYAKFLRSLKLCPENVLSVRCGGCQPITQSDWTGGKSRHGVFYFGAYEDERLSDDNFVCFSRCGNEKFPLCRQDGRIDIRYLKINELWKYVAERPTELIEKDKHNLIENDKANEENYRKLFDILIPFSKNEQKKKEELTIAVTA